MKLANFMVEGNQSGRRETSLSGIRFAFEHDFQGERNENQFRL